MNLAKAENQAFNESFEEAQNAGAVHRLNQIAEAGDAEAQYELGKIYLRGSRDVYQDEELAWRFFQKSAAQGHIKAAANLLVENASARHNHLAHIPPLEDANLEITTPDVRSQLEEEAKSNCPEALHLLGMFSLEGIGEEPDDDRAVTHFKTAMELGDFPSMVMFALMAPKCREDVDFGMTVELLEKAFLSGECAIAGYMLGRFHINLIGHCQNRRRGYEYLVAAAEQGECEAAYLAGHCKANGIGTKRDEREAYELYLSAAKGKSREACYTLSSIDRELPTIKVTDDQKTGWLRESVRLGYPPAMCRFAWDLITEDPTDEQKQQGLELLETAAERQDGDAQYKLGLLYYNGKLVAENENKAADLWQASAENEDPEGLERYGFCLFFGVGRETQPYLAEYYFGRALEQRITSASIGLGYIYHHIYKDDVKASAHFYYGLQHMSKSHSHQAHQLSKDIWGSLNPEERELSKQQLMCLTGRFMN
jgi:uncharacterized protein